MTAMEIWLLERAEPLYKIYPWKDVYKRQIANVRKMNDGIDAMFHENVDLEARDSPVSYTHLKEQKNDTHSCSG